MVRTKFLKYFKGVTSIKFIPRWSVFTLDLIVVLIAFLFSGVLLEGVGLRNILNQNIIPKSSLFIFFNTIFFYFFGIYKGVIRHSTLKDLLNVAYAQASSFITLMLINYLCFYVLGLTTKPYASTHLLITCIFSFIILTLYRVLIKIIFQQLNLNLLNKKKEDIIIYGVNSQAISILNTLKENKHSKYNVKALVKTGDKNTKVKKINQTPIYSTSKKAYVIARKHNVTSILLASDSITLEEKQKLVNECLEYKIQVLHLPNITSINDSKTLIKNIRNIKIQDLLGRSEINISNENISNNLKNKVVFISGAAGSIGSEIVQQLLNFKPKKLILFDQAETPLHNTSLKIKELVKINTQLISIIGDVRDKIQIESIFSEHRPEIIYHAAAYKHVPLMECNPSQAILTNVIGTKNIADTASKYDVKRFVMVSTDKAVNPSNVMGASKRIAEMYVQSLSKIKTQKTKFITTRFGNVLGSNGSVVPLFTKQIEEGGPITITHPDIIRYFMTIPEACQLVLEAGSMGKGGEIYIFDMGKPIKIIDLAIKMIRLAGLEPYKDIDIKSIGLRPGEKLYEELLYNTATTIPTHNKKIMIAVDNINDMNLLKENIEKLTTFAKNKSTENLIIQMKKIVPEFKSLNSKYEKYDT